MIHVGPGNACGVTSKGAVHQDGVILAAGSAYPVRM